MCLVLSRFGITGNLRLVFALTREALLTSQGGLTGTSRLVSMQPSTPGSLRVFRCPYTTTRDPLGSGEAAAGTVLLTLDAAELAFLSSSLELTLHFGKADFAHASA